MSKQDEPKIRIEKNPMLPELDSEPEHPNLVAGADMSVIVFFDDILRWIERRRAAKKRAKDSSGK
jgi:hypothetical protein